MTVLTDYLLGIWVLWLGLRLWRQGRRLNDRATGDWSLVFIFSAWPPHRCLRRPDPAFSRRL